MRDALFLFACLTALYLLADSSSAQEGPSSDDVKKGRDLALLVCSNCHVVARDQPFEPILQPPAASFESIAQRSSISLDSVQSFVSTTHRGLNNPKAMPNPQLLDYQVKQVAAYLLSLRKQR
jgi:mono/diheme cytochrome c family protein